MSHSFESFNSKESKESKESNKINPQPRTSHDVLRSSLKGKGKKLEDNSSSKSVKQTEFWTDYNPDIKGTIDRPTKSAGRWARVRRALRSNKNEDAYNKFIGWGEFEKRLPKAKRLEIIDREFDWAVTLMKNFESSIVPTVLSEYGSLHENAKVFRQAALTGPDQAAREVRDSVVSKPDSQTTTFRQNPKNEKYEFERLYREHTEKIVGMSQQIETYKFNEFRDSMARYFARIQPSDAWFKSSDTSSAMISRIGRLRKENFIQSFNELKREAIGFVNTIERVDPAQQVTGDQNGKMKKCNEDYYKAFLDIEDFYKKEDDLRRKYQRIDGFKDELSQQPFDDQTKRQLKNDYNQLKRDHNNAIATIDLFDAAQRSRLSEQYANFNKMREQIEVNYRFSIKEEWDHIHGDLMRRITQAYLEVSSLPEDNRPLLSEDRRSLLQGSLTKKPGESPLRNISESSRQSGIRRVLERISETHSKETLKGRRGMYHALDRLAGELEAGNYVRIDLQRSGLL